MQNRITIAFTGDLLVYRSLIKKSRRWGRYDFSDVFAASSDLFTDVDYVVGNLETPLAGRKSGYTRMDMLFNTPDEFAISAKHAGFSMFTTANNHCLDKGVDGLKRTIDTLDNLRLDHTGTFSTQSEKRYFIKQIGNVNIAFISCTYGTNPNVNGVVINKQDSWLVNMTKKPDDAIYRSFIKKRLLSLYYCLPTWVQNRVHPLYPSFSYDDNVRDDAYYAEENAEYLDSIKSIIREAKENADFVICCLHAGGQFNSKVGFYTQRIIDDLAKEGLDAIITNHPHCVLSSEHKGNCFVAYSLGNFTFTPNEGYYLNGVYGDYGIVLYLTIDTIGKHLVDISFSVIKSSRLSNGGTRVFPIYALYKSSLNPQEKEELLNDTQCVVNRFMGTSGVRFGISERYSYFECLDRVSKNCGQ